MRGATLAASIITVLGVFQSTLLMRGATKGDGQECGRKSISIHAPHARSDGMGLTRVPIARFQSTLLMRGATSRPMAVAWVELISIHAPHARSDRMGEDYANHHHISIHAPHARSDATRHLLASRILRFQSTLLMRGATCPRHASQCRYSDFNPRSSCEERPEPFSR